MVVTNSHNGIATALKEKAGVRVSSEWLTACLAHLRETHEAESEEQVLHQILYSDLRNVVQRDQDNGILRQALSQEHTILPTCFLLMVQVEEFLDVSLNAEARLQVGPASATAPTPVGNQQLRCLKLYLSDGYNPTSQHLVAMETSPISNLSVNSKAGMKLLLRGAIPCRHGILMCNNDHVQVLGGSVVSLVEIQQKAMEQAKKVAGVGVDPTIKALIWHPEGANDGEEEQDEGDGESRDVDAAPPAAPLPPPPAVIQRAPPPPPFQQPPRRQQQQQQNPPPARIPGNPYASQGSRDASNRPAPLPAVAPLRAVVDLSVDDNDDEPMPQAPPLDLVTPTYLSTTAGDTLSVAARTTRTSQDSSSQETGVHSTEMGDTEPVSFAELLEIVTRIQTDPQVYRQYESKVFVVPCRMIGNHQNFNIERKKKKKRDRQHKDDKYVYSYIMSVNAGTSDSQDTILCHVASGVLTSFFEMEASEMRQLQKSQPEKCQQIVQEKGLKIKTTLVRLASWHLKLIYSDAEFFDTADNHHEDTSKPILQLIRHV